MRVILRDDVRWLVDQATPQNEWTEGFDVCCIALTAEWLAQLRGRIAQWTLSQVGESDPPVLLTWRDRHPTWRAEDGEVVDPEGIVADWEGEPTGCDNGTVEIGPAGIEFTAERDETGGVLFLSWADATALGLLR